MLRLVTENEQPHSSNSLEDAAPLFISPGCKQLSIHIINFLLGSSRSISFCHCQVK